MEFDDAANDVTHNEDRISATINIKDIFFIVYTSIILESITAA